ncbi:MAG: aldo/keto reductase [Thermoanaerobaculia bacterium]|nr:aldo/keto reductase [Thermoanaerobaculia bacterium]
MKSLSFPNGDGMPVVGLGTWKSRPGEVGAAVRKALRIGYRHIDCAPIYGNEAEIGEALVRCFDEGLVDRDDLWVTSKLWNDRHARDDVVPALEETLKDLELDFLDLYLIHWPVAQPRGVVVPRTGEDLLSLEERPLLETWRGMEAALEMGLCRHIGVSNFSVDKLGGLLERAVHPPEANQVELHPYLQQERLVEFCQSHQVAVTAYSPLGSRDRPKSMKRPEEPLLLEDPTIQEIAERLDAEPAQVLLAWALHRDTAVIPKSVNPDHLRANLAATTVDLDEEAMGRIGELERGFRYVDGSEWVKEGSPYTMESVWDEPRDSGIG